MIITAITGCKNEQDIIEPFVRHTLKFCDRLLVLDNSLDESKVILANLSSEFPQITLISDSSTFAYDQKQTMTTLLRTAVGLGCDYVVPLDTDEFISAPNREIFEKHLESIPQGGCGLTPWQTYVSTYLKSSDAMAELIYRRKQEKPQYYKCIVNVAGFPGDDFVIEMGNHEVLSPNGRKVEKVTLDLPLFHFPVRSYDQFVVRIIVNWMSQLTRNPNMATSGSAVHIRDLFGLLCDGKFRCDSLFAESMSYAQESAGPWAWSDIVQDDPKIDLTRKYSTGRPMPAIQLLAREWQKSLTGGQSAAAGQ